jgi:hypothetical protein
VNTLRERLIAAVSASWEVIHECPEDEAEAILAAPSMAGVAEVLEAAERLAVLVPPCFDPDGPIGLALQGVRDAVGKLGGTP